MSICPLIRHPEITFGEKLPNEYTEQIAFERPSHNKADNQFLSVQSSFWSYGDYELVGHGKQTSPDCGTFNKFMGCLNYELHNQARFFDETIEKDAVWVKPIYHSCDKPTCPVCAKFGWAVREAYRMEARLKVASNRLGSSVEHIVASIRSEDYGLSLEALRKKVVKLLANRGIIGGSIIFHGFRYANRFEAQRKGVLFGWRWSPHFHILGFVGGEGYTLCRKCKGGDCYACKGFEGVTRRENKKDGWVVKVLDKRKTVGGTCWYQLNHCSIRRGSKKSHATTWFGACSYRKLEIINGDGVGIHHKCPICDSELVHVRYLSENKLLFTRRGEVLSMFAEDGIPLWEVVNEGTCRGGCG
jgi:hypothetical protein